MKMLLTLLILAFTVPAQAQVTLGYKSKGARKKVTTVLFSPDGNTLAFTSANYVNLARKGTPKAHSKVKTSLSRIHGACFIDDTKLLVWGQKKYFKVVRGERSPVCEIVDIDNFKVSGQMDFSPFVSRIEDVVYINDTLFGIVGTGKLNLVNPEKKTGKTIHSLAPSITDIFYDDRAKVLYTTHRNGTLSGVNPATGEIVSTTNVTRKSLLSGAVSNNGKHFVLSDTKGNSYFIEKNDTGLVVTGSAKTNKGPVYDVTFSPDGQYFATADHKRAIIFTSAYKRPIHKLKFPGAGTINSLAFDPKGDFLASGAYLKKKIRMYNTAALNIVPTFKHKNKNDVNPPQIMVTNPASARSSITVSANNVEIKGLVVDDYGLNFVKINGVPVTVSSTGDFSMEFPLAIGDNLVQIEATDVNDNVAVKKLNIKRENLTAMDFDLDSKNHLLIISIDNYKHWPALSNAVSDADRVKKVLAEKYDFEDENIISVTDTSASRNGILDGFKKLIENSGPNDNILIYFSGHGYFDATLGEGYWIPFDAEKGKEGDYFSNASVLQLIKRIQSKHIFLVADACFSGSLFADAHRGYTENVGQYKSRWGLASGRLEFVSDGSQGEQSPFNKHLVDYLEKNEEKEFAVSQLIQYVKIKVANETDQTPIGNPLRNTGDEGGEFIFKKSE